MSDLWNLAPDLKLTDPSLTSALAALEAAGILTADLLLLDSSEIARRASALFSGNGVVGSKQNAAVSALKLRLLADQIAEALVKDIHDVESASAPRGAGLSQKREVISTLDDRIDALLNGGFPIGYVSEVVGESGAGKTQLMLTLLLSAQLLSSPSDGGKASAIYVSTEAALSTTRVLSLLANHPALKEHQDRPSLDRIHALTVPDLEAQEHILTFQLPIAVKKFGARLVVLDSVAANYRAEFQGGSKILQERGKALASLGALLRRIARENDCAVVVANQVADRFEPLPPASSAFKKGSQSPELTRSQAPGSSGPSSSAPSGSGGSQLLPGGVVDADRRTGVVTQDVMSYDHQLRFCTGWDGVFPDEQDRGRPEAEPLGSQKTPALGPVWSGQISARVVLKKGKLVRVREGEAPKRRRWIGVAFSGWCESTEGEEEGLDFEVWRGGIRALDLP